MANICDNVYQVAKKRAALPLLVLLSTTPVLSVFAPKAIAPALQVLLASYVFLNIRRVTLRDYHFSPINYLVASIFIISMVSIAWTSAPIEALEKIAKLAIIAIVTGLSIAILSKASAITLSSMRRAVIVGLALGLSVLLLALVIDKMWGLAPLDGSQAKAIAVLMIWFILAFPAMELKGRIICLAMLSVAIFLSSGISDKIVFVAAALLGFSFYALRRIEVYQRYWVSFCILVFCLLAPLLALGIGHFNIFELASDLPTSLRSRLEIWEQAARRISEKPLTGWGFASARYIPNRGEISWIYPMEPMPIAHMHPHNTVLQIWLEIGALGAVLWGILFSAFSRRVSSVMDTTTGICLQVAVFTVFLFNLSLWGAWQSWFVSFQCGALLGGVVIFHSLKNEGFRETHAEGASDAPPSAF